jgi:ABC-2 type transport system permease protein
MAPISTVSFVVGKTIPYLGISLLSSMTIIFSAMALFGLPMRGSWLMLLVATSLFLIGALGTGLFISTIADSQLVAFQVVLLAAFLPTMILSGFIFPISSMPVAIQAITLIVPARYFLIALRGIVLKGAGVAAFWPQLVLLTVYAVGVLGLASVRLARQRA